MFFLTVTAPIPAGIFAPLMLSGSILGRMYGYILKFCLDVDVDFSKYAVVAAAAVSASSTRFLCMTVLVVEVTEDVNIIFLVMISVLFAYGTGNLFTKSFFSSNIELRKLPYCSKLMKHDIYLKTAKDIMIKPNVILYLDSELHDIYQILTKGTHFSIGDWIPVIDKEGNYFKGVVKISHLIKYLKKELKSFTGFSNSSWVKKMHVFLKIYRFLDEEVIFRNYYSLINNREKSMQ